MSNSKLISAEVYKEHNGDDRDTPRSTEDICAGSRTFAEKAAAQPPDAQSNGAKPVFIRQSDVPNSTNNAPTGEEIYLILSKVTSITNIMGVQKVGSLWRIYVTDKESRIELITEGLHMIRTLF